MSEEDYDLAALPKDPPEDGSNHEDAAARTALIKCALSRGHSEVHLARNRDIGDLQEGLQSQPVTLRLTRCEPHAGLLARVDKTHEECSKQSGSRLVAGRSASHRKSQPTTR
jgi:hypothetical protein